VRNRGAGVFVAASAAAASEPVALGAGDEAGDSDVVRNGERDAA
jgi:hypothetical protein